MEHYFVVKFTGHIGYIKPWTAVRDSSTNSQQFLSPGTLAGINKKLFGLEASNHIVRHRLNYAGMDTQKEQTWAKLRKFNKAKRVIDGGGVINRVVLQEPELWLGFDSL